MSVSRGLAIAAVLVAIVAPARAMTEEDERAKAHYLAGQSYYDQASYNDALREFGEAYRISKKPALLYNIARCHEALGQLGDAVTMLEHYLNEEPTTSDRPAIETRIRNLKERQAAATRVKPRIEPPDASKPPAPQPGPAVTPQPAPAPAKAAAPRKRLWTWVVGGAGAGILVAALGTGISSQLTYNDLKRDCGTGACPAGIGNAQARIDRGRQLSVATDVLWPIGAAAVATGVVLFFLEGRQPSKHARIAPFFTPSSGGLVLARDF
jgi:tetratricopeptide (TPR) repeat protein